MDEVPEVRYVRTVDGVHIAFQVAGDGPMDLVVIASGLGLGKIWSARQATFPRRYLRFSRLILLDRRGTGLSDHIVDREQQLTLEAQMEDVRAVMDAAGSERAVLVGFETGFAVAAMFAATFPERTAGLVSYAARAREMWAPDYPFGRSAQELDAELAEIGRAWGTRKLAAEWLSVLNPDASENQLEIDDFVDWMQSIGGPGDAIRWWTLDRDLDLRDVLPLDQGSHPRAPSSEGPGDVGRTWAVPRRSHPGRRTPGDARLCAPVEQQRGPCRWRSSASWRRSTPSRSSSIATSPPCCSPTSSARPRSPARRGDAGWRISSSATTTSCEARSRGTEAPRWTPRAMASSRPSTGRLELSPAPWPSRRTFAPSTSRSEPACTPARCSSSTGRPVVSRSRSGRGSCRRAGASEVVVSQTVKDLVAGSGLTFEDAGERALKGVPDRWRLYRAVAVL